MHLTHLPLTMPRPDRAHGGGVGGGVVVDAVGRSVAGGFVVFLTGHVLCPDFVCLKHTLHFIWAIRSWYCPVGQRLHMGPAGCDSS